MFGELLLVLLLVPLGTAVLGLLMPGRYVNVHRYISLAGAFMTLGLSVYVFAMYEYHNGGMQFDLQYPWIQNVGIFKENGISLHLAIDGISAPLVLLNGIVAFAGVLISWKIAHRP